MPIIDNYNKEELEQIVKQSKSLREVIDKLGYTTHNGRNSNTLKNRLNKYNIDYSHFTYCKPTEIRSEENIFIENSTASQSTLRRWYKKGEYTPYICSICGQEPEWQGKPLTLILDHINGKNHDNDLSNLRWVCPNCNQQLETTGYKKMRVEITNNIEKKYYCLDCGKEISKTAQRCEICARKVSRIVERPSREDLKEMIRNIPFTKIAEQFNVSDNTVRKWCDNYNLPRKVSEIKNYNDEDWELI